MNKIFSESCQLEIWSGENFTGDRFECTDACDMNDLGSVGNDGARSAKCYCEASTTIGELNQIIDHLAIKA